MFELFLVAYPWDLTVEDAAGALDRLYGDLGVSGISLWVAAPPSNQLRAFHRNPRVFRTRGGVFFQPLHRHYEQTRCQPIVSSWITMGNPLAEISRACADRGLTFRVIVSAAAAGRMAERYPEFACKSAFGDESRTRLCLANAEVQSCLRAMALDLSSTAGVSALTLADFEIRWSDADDVQPRVLPGPVERSLLAVCFCESCVRRSQSAGIDVEAARRIVDGAVDDAFEHGPRDESQRDDFFAENASLSEHRRRQIEELNALLRKIKECCRVDLLLERYERDPPADAASGLDLSVPSAVITRVNDPADLSAVTPSRARRNELRLPANSAVGSAGAQLVRILPDVAKAGFAAVEIDHYGALSESAFTTLKQAVRFARRSAVP